ncbi:D-alanine--poly(phosphoribitol) ligase subunit DltA [Lactococcus nasutitermitis]|uniref:D-alanine--D-alanyl carrier protein ligase n=1 Tax=Lactococcus nasutitermitis TaxID=1652957 RepID=A0ABV9JIV1_9LACT|nr:D-alanine--poly(phosphoribitol) ligase subunit DltA [Lactococcus nasutitermitis]
MKLIERILEVARTYPERVVVAEKERDYTYHELLIAIKQISQELAKKAKNERPVFVFGKNDFLTLATMLAVNLTGRAYIPVDAHTPFERTEMILNAAKPSAVIVTAPVADKFDSLLQERIEFFEFDAALKEDEITELDTTQAVSGDETNYIIYTSGTTGVPKGVAVSHDNLLSFTNWMNTSFEHIEGNQILEQALYSFDLSIFSIYPSLTTGGSLVTLSREETINFKLLFERLNRSVINTWISTPSFVDICLLDPSFVAEKHPELTQFIFCGEELTHKTAQKLLAAFPEAAIYNTYGPTEATGAISSVRVTDELLAAYSRVPIGKAKSGVELRIVDDELIIVGDSVAKGYFENPVKTAEAFFELDGKRAYHTGDAGFIDEQGIFNYNGRIDFQVKFNGFRIELQDIESHLLSLPEVEKAVVLAKENDFHKVVALVAVLVVNEKTPDRAYTKNLKTELAPLIMDYMMPTKFVYLEDFPLNQNGKIDRKLLAAQVFGENN